MRKELTGTDAKNMFDVELAKSEARANDALNSCMSALIDSKRLCKHTYMMATIA
jgi:hypothetical protein